jgi:hypothetical protein
MLIFLGKMGGGKEKAPTKQTHQGIQLNTTIMLQLLTAPELLSAPSKAHRFFADVASNKFDHEGVPVDAQTIDVVVVDPSEDAIKLLIAATDWLKD